MTEKELEKKQSSEPTPERVEEERRDLERTWAEPKGLIGWLSNTNHKSIGLRMIVSAFIFFVLAGILALVMRVQLMYPENHVLGPDMYNQFFTTHGSAMMFLFAVPVMEGMAIYLVPLMIGTRNLAFPRLNALGFYVYLIGGILLFVGLLLNIGPDAGWFSYVPLSGPEFSPGQSRGPLVADGQPDGDLGTHREQPNTIVTVFKFRAPQNVAEPDTAVRVGVGDHDVS